MPKAAKPSNGNGQVADSGDCYSPGLAFAMLMNVEKDSLRDVANRRAHVAEVREFIDPKVRGRKRDWFTTRELAWVAGVSVRSMERSLARSNPPSGGKAKPTGAAFRKLAERLPEDSIARSLVEQAADAWAAECA